MQHLRAESYSPADDGEFPESGNALGASEGFRQRFGFGWTSFGLGLLASAPALFIGVKTIDPVEVGVGLGVLAMLGGARVQERDRRRRRRALLLVLRGTRLGVYREGQRVDEMPLAGVQHLGLYAGHVVTWTLFPLLGAAIGVAGAVAGTGVGRILGGLWALVFVAIAASNVVMRAFRLHFFVPVEGVRTRVALSRRDGDALLAAHPKTGGWRVTE